MNEENNIQANNTTEQLVETETTEKKGEAKREEGTVKPAKKEDSKWNSYVTKKVFAICIAGAILVSTGLGVCITKYTMHPKMPAPYEMREHKPHMGLEVRNEKHMDTERISIMDVPGDNAKEAGFQPGDQIKRIDGEDVHNSKDISDKLAEHKSGDSVKTEVERNGEKIEINSKLN